LSKRESEKIEENKKAAIKQTTVEKRESSFFSFFLSNPAAGKSGSIRKNSLKMSLV
jgi:hypothetical protein